MEKFYYKVKDYNDNESALCVNVKLNPEAICRVLKVKTAVEISKDEYDDFNGGARCLTK